MEKRVLSDRQWALMAPHCLGKPGDAGPRDTDKPLFVEAALWIVRTGSLWRDWPEGFGKCNTVFKRFRGGVKAGIWQERFDAVSGQGAGLEARPWATHSGGVSARTWALCDAPGHLLKSALMPGQRHASKGARN